MQKREYLDLLTEKGNRFYYRRDPLMPIYEELEEFLSDCAEMDNLHFAKKMLFSHELKANNQVEGYGYDLTLIENLINKKTARIKDEDVRRRILNLYRGYQYILASNEVNSLSLKKLYQILSDGLLEERDIKNMGKFYREAPVYILQNGRLDTDLEEAVYYENIPRLIESYLEFFNKTMTDSTATSKYIKSQILHFYFVYIHPYFDVNGRTSRTMALWYLLNEKIYPYIIFNRGISFAGSSYDRLIRDAKFSFDITYFLRFMMESVKVELEKEKVMQNIAQNTTHKLSGIDYQTMLYLLSMPGNRTIGDFVHFYNHLNDKKRVSEIYEEMLLPLIESDILKVMRYSKKNLTDTIPNMFLDFNEDVTPSESDLHLKRLKVFQSSKK